MVLQVKDRELRRLNGFVGNNFRMCDSLIIPNRFAAGHEVSRTAVATIGGNSSTIKFVIISIVSSSVSQRHQDAT